MHLKLGAVVLPCSLAYRLLNHRVGNTAIASSQCVSRSDVAHSCYAGGISTMEQTRVSKESILGTDENRTEEQRAGASCCSPCSGVSEPGTAKRWPRFLVWLWVVVFWVLVFTKPVMAVGWFVVTVALSTIWLVQGEKNYDSA